MTIKLNLVDESFKHDVGAVAGKAPKNIEWDRTLSQSGLTVFTNKIAFDKIQEVQQNSAFLLTEPTTIINYTPKILERMVDKFRLIFTHDSRYLQLWPEKCRWINGGGIWIGGKVGGGSIGIKPKSKLCSIVSSRKIFCDLHNFRAILASGLKQNEKVDVFGTLFGDDKWVPINQTLDDYFYSIIIENHIDDLYFTEKLLNCFATGTVPIYIGARNLGSLFNLDGVIQVHVEERTMQDVYYEIESHIQNISPDYYHYQLPAVIDNYHRCLKFETIEDYIYEAYKDEL